MFRPPVLIVLQVTKAKDEGLSIKILAWLSQHINDSRTP